MAESEMSEQQQREEKPQTPKESLRAIVRVAGVDLDGSKRLKRSLRKIPGINHQMANAIVYASGIGDKKTGKLTDDDVSKIEAVLQDPLRYGIPAWMVNRRKDYETGDDIHLSGPIISTYKRKDLNRLQKTKSYRGLRHAVGLKVRGQRTRSTGRGGTTIGVTRKKK